MSPEVQQELTQIKRELAALQQFVKQKTDQQLQYPLDNPSRQIINIDTLLLTSGKETGGAPYTNDGYIVVTVNGQNIFLMTTS